MRFCIVDHGFAALQDIYDTLVDLRTFVQINHSGFRKIVKKVSLSLSCSLSVFSFSNILVCLLLTP